MTISEALKRATHNLTRYLQDPVGASQEARWLLAHVCNVPVAQLFSLHGPLGATARTQYENLISERIINEKPLAYLLGTAPFCGLTLAVKPPILIPRHETEELVGVLIAQLELQKNLRILDLCSGSGAIALALAHHLPCATVIGSDINPAAIALAEENKQSLGLNNASFVLSDLFDALTNEAPFDLIVSNPPYITLQEWEELPPSVKKWESRLALVGGDADGLALYRIIMAAAPALLSDRLAKEGLAQLVVEHGAGQQEALTTAAHLNGFAHCKTWRDSFNNARALFCARRPCA